MAILNILKVTDWQIQGGAFRQSAQYSCRRARDVC